MADTVSTSGVVEQLEKLLAGGEAHADFGKVIGGLPEFARGQRVPGLPYTIWQLVEHLRIAQRDILEFSAPPTGGYHAREWPKDYWPESAAPGPGQWERTLEAIGADHDAFLRLLRKPGVDLLKPFSWGTGQNLLREALLIADHAAYHLGEIVAIRRALGVWGE